MVSKRSSGGSTMKSAASRKVENQTMEDILSSIRKIIADDQKTAVVSSGQPPVQASHIASISDETIDDDILALRAALNAIRGEMDGIQNSIAIDEDNVPSLNAHTGLEKREPSEDARSEGLVSEKSEQSIRKAFGELSVVAAQPVDMEETARAVLRPLLQQWLDSHLPQLVEKLVKEEIARLSGRSE